MEDIAPQLIQSVAEEFQRLYDSNSKIQTLLAKVHHRTATYAEAQEYALAVSKLIAKVFREYVSSDVLPDGKLYYNIANRLIPESLDKNYKLVSQYAADVQTSLNQNAKVGLRAQVADRDQDRIDGLVDLASNADRYDDVADQLLTAFENYSQHIVDETIRKNADFHYRSGLTPKIIRKAEAKCCKWCRGLAGVHDYPAVDPDVYRRHGNCRCTVLYDPADGKRKMQNVHTKRLTTLEEHDKIEARRIQNLNNAGTFRPDAIRSKIDGLVTLDHTKLVDTARAGKKHSHAGVYTDANNKSMAELKKSIRSRLAQVEEHENKIQNPHQYVPDWAEKDPRYQAGLLRKWEKDKIRNAEQATIELAVFEERFSK